MEEQISVSPRCEDQPCVTGDRFVAVFAHQVIADAGAEVKAFNAYAKCVQTGRRLTITSRKLSTPALLPQMPPSRNLPETLDAGIASTNAAIEKIAAKAENAIADISSLTS